ncbi:FKBP-type peptidyl-prolyl cis-trans isomerase [Oceanobacter mangrovi]|uniref:FKBP-type peptidyl-prolyl cis-trans isomerase n=1 Tax=Oceanobacter mangrovi TaxID=2862510 RepID=UPI001C8D0D16|nr:FKBP-type peptidyl-prolyl cis-trans isomerase [Oceanobacter mangrovi]
MVDIIAVAAIAILLGYALRKAGIGSKGAEENIAAGRAFLEQNGQQDGVETTASGLQYEVLQPGDGGVHPGPKTKVTVHYHGTLIDGTVFDSSVKRGEPISFRLNQVIPGWTEGVQLMTKGQKNRFYIPAELGYGKQRAGKILPGSTLIFEVELLSFED